MTDNFERRLGYISIDLTLLRESKYTLVWQVFTALSCIPIDIDFRYDLNVNRYLVLSPYLPIVPLGEKAPKYDLILNTELDNDEIKTYVGFDLPNYDMSILLPEYPSNI